MKPLSFTLLCIALGPGVLGCSSEAKAKYNEAGESAQDAMKKTGDAVSTDAKNTGVTAKVKESLGTASDVDSKDIHVDTNEKTVHLTGTVPTDDQKSRAAEIAKLQAGSEYTITNDLVVTPEVKK